MSVIGMLRQLVSQPPEQNGFTRPVFPILGILRSSPQLGYTRPESSEV
jgi:hypothetical protein